jgi:hypothetical protein
VKRFQAARKWVRAYRLSAAGRYEQALDLVRQINLPPDQRTHWRLFEVLQLSLLQRHAETLREAVAYVEKAKSRGVTTADQRYLLCFARWCGSVAFGELFPASAKPEALAFDLQSFAIEDVAPRWKRMFPMRVHPR